MVWATTTVYFQAAYHSRGNVVQCVLHHHSERLTSAGMTWLRNRFRILATLPTVRRTYNISPDFILYTIRVIIHKITHCYNINWNFPHTQSHLGGENGCKRGRLDRRAFVQVDQQTQRVAVQVVCLGLQRRIHVVLHGKKPTSTSHSLPGREWFI